jgi:asparagine synthase (glutamine-hydrolysing)
MSRAVRDAGFTVALVGSGGDELFGGYTSFRDLPALIAALGAAGSLPRALVERVATAAGAVLRLFDRGYAAQTRWAKLPGMIRRGGSTLGLYQLAYALFLPETQRLLSSVEFGSNAFRDGLPIARHQVLGGEIDSRTVLSAIGLLEQRLFLGERLLRDTDAVSMAASLETRLPLVDTSLLEVVVRMPDHSRFQPVREKRLLRTIGLKGLDPRLFDRPKAGFELPFDRWLRNALGDEIDATLADAGQVRAAGLDPPEVLRLWRAFRSGARGLYWTRVWALYSLVRWSRVNGVTA